MIAIPKKNCVFTKAYRSKPIIWTNEYTVEPIYFRLIKRAFPCLKNGTAPSLQAIRRGTLIFDFKTSVRKKTHQFFELID